MDKIIVTMREKTAEVTILIDQDFLEEINVLREAAKILKREVIKIESNINKRFRC